MFFVVYVVLFFLKRWFCGVLFWGGLCCSVKSSRFGTIIIINGTSASGKSSLQKAIQNVMPDFYLSLGLDDLAYRQMPFGVVRIDVSNIDFSEYDVDSVSHLTQDEKSKIVLAVERRVPVTNQLIVAGVQILDSFGREKIFSFLGSAAKMARCGMHRSFAAFANEGNNLVVDYISYNESMLCDLVEVLQGYKVYYISLKASLEDLEIKEKQRGTTPPGQARAQYDFIYKPDIYDLELKAYSASPEELALQVKRFVETNPEPQAFLRLEKYFNNVFFDKDKVLDN